MTETRPSFRAARLVVGPLVAAALWAFAGPAAAQTITVTLSGPESVTEGDTDRDDGVVCVPLTITLSQGHPFLRLSVVVGIDLDASTATIVEDFKPVQTPPTPPQQIRLRYDRNERVKHLSCWLQVYDDDLFEEDKTIVLRLTASGGIQVAPPRSLTIALFDDDPPPILESPLLDEENPAEYTRATTEILASMGRWIASDAVETIAGRAPGAGRQAMQAHASGLNLPLGLDETGAGADGPPGLSVWGRGSIGGFDGEPGTGSAMDADMSGGYAGLDVLLDRGALAGLAVVRHRGEGDYAYAPTRQRGSADLKLTTVLPYAHWSPADGLGMWGLLGVGWGDIALTDSTGTVETDVKTRMAAAGMRQETRLLEEIDLALKADAFLIGLEAEAQAGLPEARGEAHRLRMLLEGRHEARIFSPDRTLTPSLEIGGRWDGGDAENGLGLEVGGGLAYGDETLGLGIEARGRGLLAHGESLKEWGMSLTGTWDPGETGLGPWMMFAPGWGASGAAGAAGPALWDAEEMFARDAGADAPELLPDRLDLEAGWGLGEPGSAERFTPWAGLSMAESEMRAWKLGLRMNAGDGMSLSLENGRSEAAGRETLLSARLTW